MKKILKISGILVIVLAVLLLPLFGLYAATVGLVPGQWNYPVKQKTELIIEKLSGITPATHAYFSFLLSQRRYQEVLGLIDSDKDATETAAIFLALTKKTLFDIQSIPDVDTRVSYFSNYQTFLANARQSFIYKSDTQKDLLGIDRASSMKTFTIDSFQGEQGRLVSKRQVITTKGINEKDPVPDSLIITNITVLENTADELANLIQK